MSDFRDTLYTIDKKGNRKWVYPTVVSGEYRKWRTLTAWILVAVYLLLPWIPMGGGQAVRLDIPARTFSFFGKVFWASDTILLLCVLLTLGFSLLFFTAVFGRVWCGWACPQTVFMEFLFRPLERIIEGSPEVRRRRDQGPWTREKLVKKSVKGVLFLFIAWFLASTFLAYFIGRQSLLGMMTDTPWSHPTPFLLTCFLTGVLLFQFGWFREQFCSILCPYARFQSVLLDSHSLSVAYDTGRGEPRGKHTDGDCIDCKLCTRVCPTGIDIRNGLQLECVHCTSCIDACDSIMEKIGKPKGLIRYASEASLTGNSLKLLRPRVIFYSVLLLGAVSSLGVLSVKRSAVEIQLVRESRDVPFALLETGELTNHFHAHISNKSSKEVTVEIQVITPSNVEVVSPLLPFPLGPQEDKIYPVFFKFPSSIVTGGNVPIELETADSAGNKRRVALTLLGPEK